MTESGEIIINKVPIKWTLNKAGSRIIDPYWEETLKLENRAGQLSPFKFSYGQEVLLDIPLYEKDEKGKRRIATLFRGLEEMGYTLKNLNEDERFIAVVEALSQIKTATGLRSQFKPLQVEVARAVQDELEDGEKRFPKGLGSRQQIIKYLAVGEYAKLWKSKKRGGTEATGKPPSLPPPEATKLDKEIDQFEIQEAIATWKNRKSTMEGVTKIKHAQVIQLHTILKVLDLSLEDFMAGIEFKEVDGKFVATGRRVAQDRDPFLMAEWMKKIASQKRFIDDRGEAWSLNDWLKTTKPPTRSGGNKQSDEGDKIRTVSVPEGTVEGIATSRTRTAKMLIKSFLGSHNLVNTGKHDEGSWFKVGQPYLGYAHLEMSARQIMDMEKCLSVGLHEVFDNRERIYKIGVQVDKKTGEVPSTVNDNYMTLQPNPEYNPDVFDDEGVYLLTEETGRFYDTAEDWLTKKRYDIPNFMKGSGKRFDNQVEQYERAKARAKKPIGKTFPTTKLDWYDAYCYFIYAVDIGWRDNEAFTMSASENSNDFSEKEKKKTAIMQEGNGMVFDVKFLTRKTWGISERDDKTDRWYHVAQVMDERVKHYMQKRITQVREGIDSGIIDQSELLKKYRILTEYEGEYIDRKTNKRKTKTLPNTVHALIGADNEYIKVGTMDKQSEDDLDAKQKKDKSKIRDMMGKQARQGIIRAIMRSCYKVAIPDLFAKQPYWTTMSLHSLRHVFAQAWLKRSDGNFNFVAKRGHWGGIGILEKAYGGTTKKKLLLETIKYSKVSIEKAEAQEMAELPPEMQETMRLMEQEGHKVDYATKAQKKEIEKAGGTVATQVTENTDTAGVEVNPE